MIEIPVDIDPELVPLSWLIGKWQGTGIIDYNTKTHKYSIEFKQTIVFTDNGTGSLSYYSESSEIAQVQDLDVENYLIQQKNVSDLNISPYYIETGFWRINRKKHSFDAGPAMLPPMSKYKNLNVDDIEKLRIDNGKYKGFAIEATISSSVGSSELLAGIINGPRIDLLSDYIMLSPNAEEHTKSNRVYGLVDNHLLWAWDIEALGQEMKSHASARLAKVV